MKDRNYGIDFFRILATFMVVILHVVGHGGIRSHTELLSPSYHVSWLIIIATYCAVNCFGLISGFVLYNAKVSLSKVFALWLQVLFYSILSLVFLSIFSPNAIDLDTILSAIFPINRTHYWYMSAYFGMLLFTPLLNVIISHTDKRTLGVILLSVFIILVIIPTCLAADPYELNSGYSLIWLMLLYLIGAYISKYQIAEKIRNTHIWILIFSMVLITFLFKALLEYITVKWLGEPQYGSLLVSYTSPTILMIAIGLLLIFSKQTFHSTINKLISILSPATLGVYLVHTNSFSFGYLLKDAFSAFASYNPLLLVGIIILTSLLIYLICTIIDLGRIQLFKLLRIHKLCAVLENTTKKLLDSLFSLLEAKNWI